MSDEKPLGAWPLLSREPLADYHVFRVRKDVSRSPRTGLPHDFFVLDGPDWVNVVAVTAAREIVLVRQYRHGTASETLEIPGGAVDAGDASPLDGARRELREETGYASDDWSLLGWVEPNPAIQSNRCHTYLARNAVRVGEPIPDGGEDLRLVLRPVEAIGDLVRSGEIRHSLVLAAFHWYALHAAPAL